MPRSSLPRFGPPLSKATREQFDRLGVEFHKTQRTDPHGWYAYINKTRALMLADNASRLLGLAE